MGTDDTRRTLIFSGAGTPRLAVPPPAPLDDVDASWDAPLASMVPPVALLPIAEPLPSDDLIDDDDRPSDKVTVPNQLAPKRTALREDREDPIEEISASALSDRGDDESDRSLATTRPPPAMTTHRPTLHELARPLYETSAAPIALEQTTPTSVPPVSMDARPPMSSMPAETARSFPVPRMVTRQQAVLFIASHVGVAASVLAFVYLTRPEPRHVKREPRIALEDRVGSGTPASGAVAAAAPAEGCKVQELERVIAPRAMPGPGLDANVLESGFAVALASAPNEATGVRLDASTLRTAETLRVQSIWPVGRVTVDRGADADERMQVRLDANDLRTVTPSQRIAAQKGGIFLAEDGRDPRLLWALPGAPPKTSETVRATARSDGSFVVAVRRPGVFYVGVTGNGPMVALLRRTKTLGAPSLAPAADGAAIAWAERGTSRFSIMTAALTVDGKRATVSSPTALAEGMSPALATLPSGELLLTYSDGGAGAHRVVAQRLGPDLTPIGELVVLSEEGTNAGSPAVAVDANGRVVVAYLAIANGRAEVRATAMICH